MNLIQKDYLTVNGFQAQVTARQHQQVLNFKHCTMSCQYRSFCQAYHIRRTSTGAL